MATFQSYSITQPYYEYVEYLKFNVIPGTITLTFDEPPSTNVIDYSYVLLQGILMFTDYVGVSELDESIVFSGNTATITAQINADSNCYLQVYYEGQPLPFHIFCKQDKTYNTPAIWTGIGVQIVT